jgi:putative sigma-54 modulation protein
MKVKEMFSVQVAITTRHGSVRNDVQEYITAKSEKLLTYFERVTAIDVTIDFDSDRVAVEMLVDAEHKHNFVARDAGDEVLPTFDRVLHKMEQQIKKYKEKIQDHRRDRPLNEIAETEPAEPETE